MKGLLILLIAIAVFALVYVLTEVMFIGWQAESYLPYLTDITNIWELKELVDTKIFEISLPGINLSYTTRLKIVYRIKRFTNAYANMSNTEKKVLNMVLEHNINLSKKYDLSEPLKLLLLEDGTTLYDFLEKSRLELMQAKLSGEDIDTERIEVAVYSAIPDAIPTKDFAREFRLTERNNGYVKQVVVLQ